MNPVIIVHLFVAGLVIAGALPLIRKKVKMNRWYGVRIPESYVSEERWMEINYYGGRLLFLWGLAIAAMAVGGAFLQKKDWIAYDWAALVIVAGGLTLVMTQIYRYARTSQSG
jgi:uncharacterized membrane protein